jgi:hypothetical protein
MATLFMAGCVVQFCAKAGTDKNRIMIAKYVRMEPLPEMKLDQRKSCAESRIRQTVTAAGRAELTISGIGYDDADLRACIGA